jgi:NAD+ synthetase
LCADRARRVDDLQRQRGVSHSERRSSPEFGGTIRSFAAQAAPLFEFRSVFRMSKSLKIAMAQLNCIVGDFAGNREKILAAARQAHAERADLLVTPELALCGYPPEDLLLRPAFYRDAEAALLDLAARCPPLTLVVGFPRAVGDRRYNAAAVLRDGRIAGVYHKRHLPNYTVFDEERYFDADDTPCLFTVGGLRCAINICADVWEEGAAEAAWRAGAELLLVLNASPYHLDKQSTRYEVVRQRIAGSRLPVVYVNLVGGQDELVFDGASFVLAGDGSVRVQLPAFREQIGYVVMDNGVPLLGAIAPARSMEADVYDALTLGVADYVGKNRFPGALLGLSGGIDSALTLAVAADALGPERVHAVMMPSPYTAQMSLDDSRTMVQTLGVRYDEIAIAPIFERFAAALAPLFEGRSSDATEENLQARIRGTLLMALSNKFGAVVLTTGNKSEMATGYATLYGDMAGGFAVLKDLAKTLVYRLARYRNSLNRVIPENVISRAPSAELRANQTDQDSLPAYDVLDAILGRFMEQDQEPAEIVAAGFAPADVRRVVDLIKRNEYKRRQAPVGIRITPRGFGKDWRYPITSRYFNS